MVGRGEGRAHDGRERRSELARRGECYGRVMRRERKDGAGCGFKRDGGRSGGGNGGEETVLGERTWGHWTSLEGRPGGARRRKRGVRCFHLGGRGPTTSKCRRSSGRTSRTRRVIPYVRSRTDSSFLWRIVEMARRHSTKYYQYNDYQYKSILSSDRATNGMFCLSACSRRTFSLSRNLANPRT